MTIVFDVENNEVWGSLNADLQESPRLLRLAWATFTPAGKLISGRQHVIEPDGWEVSMAAQDRHGISQQDAQDQGQKCAKVLKMFFADYEACKEMVYYDRRFYGLLASEMQRYSVYPKLKVEKKVVLADCLPDADYLVSAERLALEKKTDQSPFKTKSSTLFSDQEVLMNKDVIAVAQAYFKNKVNKMPAI